MAYYPIQESGRGDSKENVFDYGPWDAQRAFEFVPPHGQLPKYSPQDDPVEHIRPGDVWQQPAPLRH